VGGSLETRAQGRPWWWQVLGILALIGVIALMIWLLPAAPR
jgi:hypothetical protein